MGDNPDKFSGAELPYPTPRALDGCVDGRVRFPDAHVVEDDAEDPLPDGIVCDGNLY
jgi:hypothetical protein